MLGDGSGLLLLEDYEHAKARGAKIYCEVMAAATRQGAEHLSKTSRKAALKCVEAIFRNIEVDKTEVDLINCHATATYADQVEAELIA